MRAMVLENGQYHLRECAEPTVASGNVLIKVAFAGVNRADLFQKQGNYPLPVGNPAIPGMEVSGTIESCGEDVRNFKLGERVCALISEGAYGEFVSVPAAQVLPLPKNLTLEEGAALMEACCTAWISLVWQGKLKQGETVLIHGGASGIGIIAIQIAKILGARVFATAGTPEKVAACVKVGADNAIHYKTQDYVKKIKALTNGKGVDVIMDMVGGDYFARNLEALSHGGRLSIIAFLNGAKVTANLTPVLLKHLSINGSTLRSRPANEKAQIAKELRQTIWPALELGQLKPLIHAVFPLSETEKALQVMEQSLNIGKNLIRM